MNPFLDEAAGADWTRDASVWGDGVEEGEKRPPSTVESTLERFFGPRRQDDVIRPEDFVVAPPPFSDRKAAMEESSSMLEFMMVRDLAPAIGASSSSPPSSSSQKEEETIGNQSRISNREPDVPELRGDQRPGISAVRAFGERRLSAEESVAAVEHGVPITMGYFRSLSSKRQLLTAAQASLDAETMVHVINAVKDTLLPSVFSELLSEFPQLQAQYMVHLRKMRNVPGQRYLAQRQYERNQSPRMYLKVAMPMLREAMRTRDLERRVHQLGYVLEYLRKVYPQPLAFYISSLQDYVRLLTKHQMPVENHDARALPNSPNFRRPTLTGLSLHQTMFYLHCFHDRDPARHPLPEKVRSPAFVRESFQVAEERDLWCAMYARTFCRDWVGLRALVAPKGFFSSQPHSAIGFEPFVRLLGQAQAPDAEIAYFLSLIQPESKRFEVCMKFSLYFHAMQMATHGMRNAAQITRVAQAVSLDKTIDDAYRDRVLSLV